MHSFNVCSHLFCCVNFSLKGGKIQMIIDKQHWLHCCCTYQYISIQFPYKALTFYEGALLIFVIYSCENLSHKV